MYNMGSINYKKNDAYSDKALKFVRYAKKKKKLLKYSKLYTYK